MELKLMKMQGAGNDYLFIDALHTPPPPRPRALAKMLAQRHLGTGADGLVMILPSSKADAQMQMFNADGTEGRMCGNALRCMGEYLFGLFPQKEILKIQTLSGIKTLICSKKHHTVGVNMGKVTPITTPNGIPFLVRYQHLLGFGVDVGNPHLVCFGEEKDFLLLPQMANHLGKVKCFSEGVNIELAAVKSRKMAQVRVCERGSGETLSCGTGGVAVAALGMALGYFDRHSPVCLSFSGGPLVVKKDSQHNFWLFGETSLVFKGVIEIADCL